MSGAAPPQRPVTRADHAIGALLCVGYVAVLLYTAPALGLSRDESMYVAAARSYAHWIQLLIEHPAQALQRVEIDAAFRVNREHPPLAKLLFAVSYLLDAKFGLFTRESLPFRFVGMLSAGLLLWLIHIFGTRYFGRTVGLFAALAFALLPRPFYHAHLDAFDIPITLALSAVVYAYARSLRSRRWAWLCGGLFGLALATKHNSWMLPGVLALHFAWLAIHARMRARSQDGPPLRLIPEWLIAMATLGPLLFLASWPWLWHDTGARIRRYAAFHLHHDYYNIAYFGVNYFWPPFPTSYPWIMTLFTVPVTTLLLAVLGITLQTRSELAQSRAVWKHHAPAATHDDPTHMSILMLGCMLAPMVVISLPGTPIFGGTKHWFTAYPFLVLFAGIGFQRLLEIWRGWMGSDSRRTRLQLALPLGGWLLLPALVETAHSHPFGLSHYGFAAGFVPGAADRGMNRQFWGFTTRSIVDFLEQQLPNGGRVFICDTTELAFQMLARDGWLPDNIVPTRDIANADYAIVHHEHHFAEVDHQIWTTYGTTRPAHVLTYDGVPIISVYENVQLHAAAQR